MKLSAILISILMLGCTYGCSQNEAKPVTGLSVLKRTSVVNGIPYFQFRNMLDKGPSTMCYTTGIPLEIGSKPQYFEVTHYKTLGYDRLEPMSSPELRIYERSYRVSKSTEKMQLTIELESNFSRIKVSFTYKNKKYDQYLATIPMFKSDLELLPGKVAVMNVGDRRFEIKVLESQTKSSLSSVREVDRVWFQISGI